MCKRSSAWHLGAFFRAVYVSSRVKMAHVRERSAGRCFWATYFKLLPFWIRAKELARTQGMLFILSCFVFAPSWTRKFLTSRSPLPSHFKGSHFSQLVGPVWHHLGFDKAPSPPPPGCRLIMSLRLFSSCVWSQDLRAVDLDKRLFRCWFGTSEILPLHYDSWRTGSLTGQLIPEWY